MPVHVSGLSPGSRIGACPLEPVGPGVLGVADGVSPAVVEVVVSGVVGVAPGAVVSGARRVKVVGGAGGRLAGGAISTRPVSPASAATPAAPRPTTSTAAAAARAMWRWRRRRMPVATRWGRSGAGTKAPASWRASVRRRSSRRSRRRRRPRLYTSFTTDRRAYGSRSSIWPRRHLGHAWVSASATTSSASARSPHTT